MRQPKYVKGCKMPTIKCVPQTTIDSDVVFIVHASHFLGRTLLTPNDSRHLAFIVLSHAHKANILR